MISGIPLEKRLWHHDLPGGFGHPALQNRILFPHKLPVVLIRIPHKQIRKRTPLRQLQTEKRPLYHGSVHIEIIIHNIKFIRKDFPAQLRVPLSGFIFFYFDSPSKLRVAVSTQGTQQCGGQKHGSHDR